MAANHRLTAQSFRFFQGCLKVRSSHITTPQAYTSLAGVAGDPVTISGDWVAGEEEAGMPRVRHTPMHKQLQLQSQLMTQAGAAACPHSTTAAAPAQRCGLPVGGLYHKTCSEWERVSPAIEGSCLQAKRCSLHFHHP
jgi:hypothetical protein